MYPKIKQQTTPAQAKKKKNKQIFYQLVSNAVSI
jgi:hypothetical protein